MQYNPLRKILSAICESRDMILARLAQMEKRIMSGVDDLNAAVAAIATDLTAEGVQIQAVITALQNAGSGGGLTDAQAEALAVQLQGSATVITNATTSLQNALPPSAAPAKG